MLFIILLIFLGQPSFGQDYPFGKNFIAGSITLKDSTSRKGQVKWFPSQEEKLKFQEGDKGKTEKYTPEDLLGFNADTFQFVSLFNLEVYANDYALLGKTLKIKHCFGQVLHHGKFNIYLVFATGYNAVAGSIQTYPNFLFEKKTDSGFQYAAYPFRTRMKDKKYEKAKEDLYVFFKDYPAIIEKIRAYKQQEDFFEIINLVKELN